MLWESALIKDGGDLDAVGCACERCPRLLGSPAPDSECGQLVWRVCLAAEALPLRLPGVLGDLSTRDSFLCLFICLLFACSNVSWGGPCLWIPEPFGPQFRTRTRQASFFAVSLCLWMEFFSSPLSPPKLYVFQGSSFSGHACVLFYVNFRSLLLS